MQIRVLAATTVVQLFVTGCTSTRHYDVDVAAAEDFAFRGRVRVTETRDNSLDLFTDHRPRISKVTLYGDDGRVVEITSSVASQSGMVVAVVRDDKQRASKSLPVAAK